jgi:hypothetical protein
LLESVPPGVTTWTVPVMAPEGTVVVISDFYSKVKVAAMPLMHAAGKRARYLPSDIDALLNRELERGTMRQPAGRSSDR